MAVGLLSARPAPSVFLMTDDVVFGTAQGRPVTEANRKPVEWLDDRTKILDAWLLTAGDRVPGRGGLVSVRVTDTAVLVEYADGGSGTYGLHQPVRIWQMGYGE